MVYCCVHFVTLKIIRRKASPKEKHIESKEKCCHLLYLSQAKKSMQKIKEVVKTKHAYLYVYIFVVVGCSMRFFLKKRNNKQQSPIVQGPYTKWGKYWESQNIQT